MATNFLTSLSAHYDAEEASGNATDSSGAGISLTANNSPGSGTGKIGNARLLVSASSQYFSSSNAAFNISTLTTGFTASIWVYMRSTGTSAVGTFMTKFGAGGQSYILDYAGSGGSGIRWFMRGSAGDIVVDAVSGGAFGLSAWAHIVFGWDKTNTKSFVQVNGGTRKEVSSGVVVPNTSTTDFELGRRNSGSLYGHFDWDLFSVWRERVLTSAEAIELYNSGNGLAFADYASGQPASKRMGGVRFANSFGSNGGVW